MYTIKGEVKVIKETQKITDTFSKREFTLTDKSGQYEQTIGLQLSKDNCSIIDNFNVGAKVEVFFNLRGREWTSPQGDVRVFNTLDVWKINSQTPEAIKQEETGGDNLPF
jgi:hypothetical protein